MGNDTLIDSGNTVWGQATTDPVLTNFVTIRILIAPAFDVAANFSQETIDVTNT